MKALQGSRSACRGCRHASPLQHELHTQVCNQPLTDNDVCRIVLSRTCSTMHLWTAHRKFCRACSEAATHRLPWRPSGWPLHRALPPSCRHAPTFACTHCINFHSHGTTAPYWRNDSLLTCMRVLMNSVVPSTNMQKMPEPCCRTVQFSGARIWRGWLSVEMWHGCRL